MVSQKLPSTEVWKAIDIYLSVAYTGAAPPSPVRAKLETLRSVSQEDFFQSPVFERDPSGTSKLSLRLGNRMYPHMKLTIERAPDKSGYLFRADTHDRHACPQPGSREYAAFTQLMEHNQKIAQVIEQAWADQQLPTFKTFLREDLARRARETQGG